MSARPWPRRPDRRCPRLASLASGSAGRTLACEALTERYVTHTITRPLNRGNPTLRLGPQWTTRAATPCCGVEVTGHARGSSRRASPTAECPGGPGRCGVGPREWLSSRAERRRGGGGSRFRNYPPGRDTRQARRAGGWYCRAIFASMAR